MNRPKSPSRKNWPDYLVCRKRSNGDYYTWKHPHTGKEYALGYSFPDAAAQAREANLKILIEKTSKATLTDRLENTFGVTMSEWLDTFQGILNKRPSKKKNVLERAESTKRIDARKIQVLKEHFKDSLVAKVSTKECADLLQKYKDKGHDRAAVDMRSFMVDCFTEAEAAGLIPRGENPATITSAPPPRTKRSRLMLEDFKKILDGADGWFRTSILLGIITGQRVWDVANMSYANVKNGFLHVEQIKTGARIRIPLGLELLGYTLGDVIKQSRKIVGAKMIVHQTHKTSRSSPGEALHEGTISRKFSAAVAELKGEWAKPPTFHELRSLSKRLHRENGINTLDLLGHESEETGNIYLDPREGWVEVKIPARKV